VVRARMMCRSLFAVLALIASFASGHAAACFSSASAVRQEDPEAWPSWTLRAPGGTKCWYPTTRGAARNHWIPTGNENGAQEVLRLSDKTSGFVPHAELPTNATGLPDQAPQASFADRFSAVFEGNFIINRTGIQRVLDLFRGLP
jgi:hypothetical protein